MKSFYSCLIDESFENILGHSHKKLEACIHTRHDKHWKPYLDCQSFYKLLINSSGSSNLEGAQAHKTVSTFHLYLLWMAYEGQISFLTLSLVIIFDNEIC